jgi:hypothetical protein
MNKYLTTMLAGAALALASCSKDTVPEEMTLAPQTSTESVSDVKRASALISGAVKPQPGQTFQEYGIIWSRNQNLDYEHNDGIFRNQTKATCSGLLPGTTYYFAPYAKNAMTVVLGNVMTFTTARTSSPELAPVTITRATETSGTVTTTLNDVGSETAVVMRGYIYKEATAGEGSIAPEELLLRDDVDIVGGIGQLQKNEKLEEMIPNLRPGKVYAVRAYAVAEGVGYSDIAYITTRPTTDPALSVIDEDQLRQGLLSAYFIQPVASGQTISEVGFCYLEGAGTQPTVGNAQLVEAELRDDGHIVGYLPRMGTNTTYSIRPYVTTRIGDTQNSYYGEISEITNDLDLSGYVTQDLLRRNYYNTTAVDSLIAAAEHNMEEINNQLEGLVYSLRYTSEAEYGQLQQTITNLQNEQNNITSQISQLQADLYATRLALIDSIQSHTPSIGADGNWYIGTTNTGISASGIKGDKGDKGDTGATGVSGVDGAQGEKGEQGEAGYTPYIGPNGNWFINTTDTGIKADRSEEIAALQQQIDELRTLIGNNTPQNIAPLPAVFQGATATASSNTSVSALATLNMAQYRQNYVDTYGANTTYGQAYYTQLFPISMTGFIYSAANPEPSLDSYAAMYAAKADSLGTFAYNIEGLQPGTTYYVRAFAVNSWGTTLSSVVTVTTAGSSGATPSSDDNPYPGTISVKRRR